MDSPPRKSILPFPITAAQLLHVLSPVIAIVSGVVATWLFSHFPALHILGSADSAARVIAEGLIFIVTAAGAYLVHYKLIDAAVQFRIFGSPALEPGPSQLAQDVRELRAKVAELERAATPPPRHTKTRAVRDDPQA